MRRTPLFDDHVRLGARIVDFAGWEMPVQYAGVIQEHRAVRSAAGLFDVSHMGQLEITGADATDFIQYMTSNDVAKMWDGKAQYSLLLNERGTVIDDVIVYRFSPRRYLMVVNAANTARDLEWIRAHRRGDTTVDDRSDDYALLALQGPRSSDILQSLTDVDLASIKTYGFDAGRIAAVGDVIIARTGYTGEDGFELFCAPAAAATIWNALLEAGADDGIQPAGLGARDTLRIEMKYSLYGHEISEDTTPYEAGLGWVVKLKQPADFIGKEALISAKEQGLTRRLAGFVMRDRGIPRPGYAIARNGEPVGVVTSGTHSPSLDVPIGIGFVPADAAEIGTTISIDIRGRFREARIVETPFYKKQPAPNARHATPAR